MRRHLSASLLASLFCAVLSAQVRAMPDRQQWFLTSGESTYVVGVDEKSTLR